jgi:hypothetical protein
LKDNCESGENGLHGAAVEELDENDLKDNYTDSKSSNVTARRTVTKEVKRLGTGDETMFAHTVLRIHQPIQEE